MSGDQLSSSVLPRDGAANQDIGRRGAIERSKEAPPGGRTDQADAI